MASSYPLLPGFAPTQDLNVLKLNLADKLQTSECSEAGIQPGLRTCNILETGDEWLPVATRAASECPRPIAHPASGIYDNNSLHVQARKGNKCAILTTLCKIRQTRFTIQRLL